MGEGRARGSVIDLEPAMDALLATVRGAVALALAAGANSVAVRAQSEAAINEAISAAR